MIIKVTNHEKMVKIATDRLKVLKAKLDEAKAEGDSVAAESLGSAVNQLTDIKSAAKAECDMSLDEDDRFILNLSLADKI